MEEKDQKPTDLKNGLTKTLRENLVTVLDLRHANIANVDNIELPPSLIELNLSNNNLKCVPVQVLNLKCLKLLNLSNNRIKSFEETPFFCHVIEKLDLSYNELCRPPLWVWCKSPKNLEELDISYNTNITNAMNIPNSRQLIQYKTPLTVIKMCGCRINSQYTLLETFTNAKVLDLSNPESLSSANVFHTFPCRGLDMCCDVERLNLSHTWLYEIKSNIDVYSNLIEIDLSQNTICSLPSEFCNLKNLEICILSFNVLMYLPDDIVNLKKLKTLCVDSNRLCTLPDSLGALSNLTKLDIYDNYIYDPPEGMDRFEELDLAQNYFDEPGNEAYIEMKKKLRSQLADRLDGRKFENVKPDSMHSPDITDESYSDAENTDEDENNDANRSLSSPEDWDSDDYWVPHFPPLMTPQQSAWLIFIKRKMAEGNFCPIDAHPISVMEKVRYENICNPYVLQESDGQFDDYSADDS